MPSGNIVDIQVNNPDSPKTRTISMSAIFVEAAWSGFTAPAVGRTWGECRPEKL